MKLLAVRKVKFQKAVWDYYSSHQRNSLPWRKSITPYKIWISEVMLQQTQVDRVVPYFKKWMKTFPTVRTLASAPQSKVLRLWKGLGYNSRALRLKRAAQKIVEDYGGKPARTTDGVQSGGFPKKYEVLLKLPGIGPYTAGAICAFAWDEKIVLIETNIRRVFLHHFFSSSVPPLPRGGGEALRAGGVRTSEQHPSVASRQLPLAGEQPGQIHDREILDLVAQTLPEKNIREWYWALMDYGSFLGKTEQENPNRKSRHYTKQSKFIGSDRQIRGKILEILLVRKKLSIETLQKNLQELSTDSDRTLKILDGLEQEGFVEINQGKVFIKK